MKTITQADLSDLSDKYTWLAINKHGDLHGYEEKPVPCDTVSGYEYQRTAIWLGGGYDATNWQDSAIRREVDSKHQPQEPYFLMKGDLFYRHSYRGYSDFSAWAGVYDKDEAIAYAEKSGGSVIAKPARNFYHEPEEIDRMIERLQLIRQALRDSPNGY